VRGAQVSPAWAPLLLLLLGLACQPQPTPRQVRGVIVEVVPRDIAHAAAIQLRLDDGQVLRLAVADSVQFPPGHLREHMVFAEPVSVTYLERPDGALATAIAD
jgi:uncharacterized protein YwbE